MAGAVAAGPDSMWVTSAADGTVWRIDPKTHRVLKLAAHGTPTRVAVDAGKAVVTDGPDRRVLSLNERTGATGFVATLQRNGSGDLLLGDGKAGAWYADPANGVLGKVDDVLASGSPSAQISIPQNNTTFVSPYLNFDGIAVGEGGVWVAGDQQDRVVWRLDPATHGDEDDPHSLRRERGRGRRGRSLGRVALRRHCLAHRPANGAHRGDHPVGRGPYSLAVGDGSVWVTGAIDDTLSRIDPRTNRVSATIPLHGAPRSAAIGAGGVWVTTTPPCSRGAAVGDQDRRLRGLPGPVRRGGTTASPAPTSRCSSAAGRRAPPPKPASPE
jgi:YVTN family beta-propeller protein